MDKKTYTVLEFLNEAKKTLDFGEKNYKSGLHIAYILRERNVNINSGDLDLIMPYLVNEKKYIEEIVEKKSNGIYEIKYKITRNGILYLEKNKAKYSTNKYFFLKN